MKKMPFAKIIFIIVTVMVLYIIIFSSIMMWRTNDLTPLAYLIPAIFAEFATATGYYFWKSKNENTVGGIVYDTAMKGSNDEN